MNIMISRIFPLLAAGFFAAGCHSKPKAPPPEGQHEHSFWTGKAPDGHYHIRPDLRRSWGTHHDHGTNDPSVYRDGDLPRP